MIPIFGSEMAEHGFFEAVLPGSAHVGRTAFRFFPKYIASAFNGQCVSAMKRDESPKRM